ncbi:MAG TPA: Gfo/Idh/MocA family oxidoreductase, partial [Pseudacidobacterium sp.]|nr:Gfo/Idh/MocA family oxidoreductase [Pseudacidobacterium sp.]
MTDPAVQNVVVCGGGVFGLNHLRIYRTLQQSGHPVRLTAIIETDEARVSTLTSDWRVPVYHSIDACLRDHKSGNVQIDAASVCVPTVTHFQTASALLHAGIDVLVEKPITSSLDEADRLIDI